MFSHFGFGYFEMNSEYNIVCFLHRVMTLISKIHVWYNRTFWFEKDFSIFLTRWENRTLDILNSVITCKKYFMHWLIYTCNSYSKRPHDESFHFESYGVNTSIHSYLFAYDAFCYGTWRDRRRTFLQPVTRPLSAKRRELFQPAINYLHNSKAQGFLLLV